MHKNAALQSEVRKKYLPLKEKQPAYDICSFCMIVAYRLKPVLVSIYYALITSFLLFEVYVTVSYMKVKFLHNLLQLVLKYYLKCARNRFYIFIIFEKKVCPTDSSDRITQVKNFNQNFVVNFKNM